MRRAGRMLIATALAAAALPAGHAAAATWTEIPSGTAQDITAIEYQSPTRFWFTTASGAIFTRQPSGSFLQTKAPSGLPLYDIEFQDGGQVGIAVGKTGQVYRSNDAGATWSSSLGGGITVSRDDGAFVDCTINRPLGDVYSVRFAGNDRAWIFAQGSQIARSQGTAATVGQAGTWVDANDAGATCKVNSSYADGYADAFFIPSNPDVGYIVAASFSEVFLTTNNLASNAAKQTADAGNAGSKFRKITGDPANPNRMWAAADMPYGISTTAFTRDGFTTSDRWHIVNDTVREFNPVADVDFSGGTVLAAGNAGEIVNSIDGENFFHVMAGGALATAGWKAVGLASATLGAVGGQGGKLALTSDANATPDVVPPTGTISGPTQLNAGQSGTYTLNAADNAGGSGINGGSITWTATGLPGGTGNPVTFAFPNAGFYTIRVHFTDNAGNGADAQISVSVGSGPTITPVLSLKGPGNTATAVIVGSRIKVRMKGSITMPPGVDKNAACTGQIRLKLKKGTRTMLNRTTPVKLKNGKCRFAKTVFLQRSKVGKTRRLKLKIRFLGNQILKAGTVSKTLTIRK